VKKIFRNLRSKSDSDHDDASIYSLDDLDSIDVQNELYYGEDEDDTESFSSDLTVVLDDEIETDYETSHDYEESDTESSFKIPPPLPKIYRVSSEPRMCKKCD
jgi:neutral trehalase